jgi:RNA polymerase sigma-70 factor (ECF subfamily)
MMTDAQALKTLRRDPEAVCALYDRYVTELVRFLCRAGAAPEVAWDVTQETFARLLDRGYRGPVTPELSAWPWLAVTSRNLLRDWQRRGRVDQSARIKVGARAVVGAESDLDEALARVDADRAAETIASALDSLSPSQRDAVLGRVVDEKDYDLLAEEALASEQTIRRRVSRGLGLIRARVEEGNT